MYFKAREDHPPRQAHVSYRLYLFPQGFLHQAHSCSGCEEWLLKDYFSADFKTQTATVYRKELFFLKGIHALGEGINAWLTLFSSFADAG